MAQRMERVERAGPAAISPETAAPVSLAGIGGSRRWLAAILLAGAAVRLALLLRDVPTLDSDEAVVGLMALHALHGDFTVFFWGQSYMGSLEALLAAPFVALLGPTTIALRLSPTLIGLAFVATVYALGSRLYSPRVGLAGAALLGLGPPFFITLSVRAYGGYTETLLFGNLLLLLALAGHRPAGQRASIVALLGFVAGLAVWTDLLVVPFLLGAGAIGWWQRRRDLLGRNGLVLAAGALMGLVPALIYNIVYPAATLTTLLGLTLVGGGGHHVPGAALLANLWSILTVALPILAGTDFGGTQAAGYTVAEYHAAATVHVLDYTVGLALGLAALALLMAAAVSVGRARGALRLPTEAADKDTAAGQQRLTRQGEAAQVLICACYLAAFALTKEPNIFATPRYLLPLYAALPLLVARAGSAVRWLCGRGLPAGYLPKRLAPALGAAALAALLLWNVSGTLALTPLQTAARDHSVWIASDDAALLRLLRAHGIRTVISNDYWEGLRLTYESGERIVTVMVTPEGHPGFNRYPPYVAHGLADPRPAYVELLGTPEAALRAAELRAGMLHAYTYTVCGPFAVFLPG